MSDRAARVEVLQVLHVPQTIGARNTESHTPNTDLQIKLASSADAASDSLPAQGGKR